MTPHATAIATVHTRDLGSAAKRLVHDAARAGTMVGVHSGAYADLGGWEGLKNEEKIRERALAVAQRSGCRIPVFSHTTAAAFWRLPIYRVSSRVIHVTVPTPHPHASSTAVFRHKRPLADDEVAVVDGVRVTTLARTVYDVITSTTAETAVSAFDGALRLVAWSDETREYDERAAAAFTRQVRDLIIAHAGARGIRQARFLISLADGRAQLPGESRSRLWMHELGISRPVLQHPVRCGRRVYRTDFAWPQSRTFGEFDGEGKYLDAALTSGRSLEEVLFEQDRREREIIAATGWRAIRWGSREAADLDAFRAFARRARLLGSAP